jgi:hypothetical protein
MDTMTKNDFDRISADIKTGASRTNLDLTDPANAYTVWLEDPIGSGYYVMFAKTADLQNAQIEAGRTPRRSATIYGGQGNKIQIVMVQDGKWSDTWTK